MLGGKNLCRCAEQRVIALKTVRLRPSARHHRRIARHEARHRRRHNARPRRAGRPRHRRGHAGLDERPCIRTATGPGPSRRHTVSRSIIGWVMRQMPLSGPAEALAHPVRDLRPPPALRECARRDRRSRGCSRASRPMLQWGMITSSASEEKLRVLHAREDQAAMDASSRNDASRPRPARKSPCRAAPPHHATNLAGAVISE